MTAKAGWQKGKIMNAARMEYKKTISRLLSRNAAPDGSTYVAGMLASTRKRTTQVKLQARCRLRLRLRLRLSLI